MKLYLPPASNRKHFLFFQLRAIKVCAAIHLQLLPPLLAILPLPTALSLL